MKKILCFVLLITSVAALNFSASGQGGARRGGPFGDMFQGQTPPPGAVTVLGRSFLGSLQTGFGNSLALLIGADDQNVRRELGLTDAEVNSIQLVRAQMLMSAPMYATRFKSMTEENQKSIQDDLLRDMGRITTAFDKALAPERKEKVQKLVFQSLGGLDSPFIGPSSMEVLNLSGDQKKKIQSVFDEMQEERVAHMEKMLKMAEKVIAAGGPQNLSQEEREALDKERRELEEQSFMTARKLADRLRKHLTPEQLALEKQLIASRPAFLPGLPRQMRRDENTNETNGGEYAPGANSWRPGQALPVQVQEQKGTGRFPRAAEPQE
jgi:hypothetical protein